MADKKSNRVDLLAVARQRYKAARKNVEENYRLALEDLKFLNGEQWNEEDMESRKGRPCLTINKLPGFVDQVHGDLRQNKPSIKIRPQDSNSDPETAEIYAGLIRNIEYVSRARVAYKTAGESQASCGFGAFRILTEYSDDDTWDQDIRIKRITNPFSVSWDPAAKEHDLSDAGYLFIEDEIDEEDYKEAYPDHSPIDFDSENFEGREEWHGEGRKIKVAEYFYKDPCTKTIYLVEGGVNGPQVVDELPAGIKPLKKRTVKTHKLMWCKIDGKSVLEGPTELPCRNIPVAVVFGKELNINGKSVVRGVIRNAKDPQRLYNYMRSASAEAIALTPKAPFIATARQVGKYLSMWKDSIRKNLAVLLYEPDEKAPGPPMRSQPPAYNPSLDREIQISGDEMKATTSLYDASLGATSNEVSGRAIMARQRKGDVANFAYMDNLSLAIEYAGKVLVEMIPKVYDTERIVRVRGVDGKEKFVAINQTAFNEAGEPVVINDLSVGKYDVAVDVGPSYTTQRIEAAEAQMEFMRIAPAAAGLVSDLVVKNMDWPQADEFAKRLRKALPPGLAEPEEGELPPPPKPPTIQDQLRSKAMMLDLKEREQKVAHRALELEKERIAVEKEKIELRRETVGLEGDVLDVVEKRNSSIVPNG